MGSRPLQADSTGLRARFVGWAVPCSIILGAAGILKLVALLGGRNPRDALPPFPSEGFQSGTMWFLAALEVLVALGMMLKATSLVTTWMAFGLGAGFFCYTILLQALAQDTRKCGCFGTVEVPVLAHYGITLSILLFALANIQRMSAGDPGGQEADPP